MIPVRGIWLDCEPGPDCLMGQNNKTVFCHQTGKSGKSGKSGDLSMSQKCVNIQQWLTKRSRVFGLRFCPLRVRGKPPCNRSDGGPFALKRRSEYPGNSSTVFRFARFAWGLPGFAWGLAR